MWAVVVGLLAHIALAVAQTSGNASNAELQCTADCYATALQSDPAPAGCASVATFQDTTTCVCTSINFATEVGRCLGGLCPLLALDISNRLITECRGIISQPSPPSNPGSSSTAAPQSSGGSSAPQSASASSTVNPPSSTTNGGDPQSSDTFGTGPDTGGDSNPFDTGGGTGGAARVSTSTWAVLGMVVGAACVLIV